MPPKKTVRNVLVDMLDDLDKMQLKKFCGAILDREGEPKVKRQMLDDKDCEDIATVLITTFTESGAIEVALETLEIIRCNAQKERLVKDLREASLNSVSSEVPPNSVSIRYGDIMKVETTGASKLTAQQDQLKYSGVTASNAMAETDLADMNNYKSNIIKAAQQKGVDPALVAALISRSSRAGRTLTDGKGCYNEMRGAYDTFGLLQLDVNPNGGGHKPKGTWDSEEHLCQALDILLYFIIRIKNTFPEWTKEQQLKGGIAAYHSGDGNIHSYEAVDAKTACGDYSNDVVARAQWYKSEGGF